ncbi:hypothetical protein KI809_04890 [Geobacter pelophilus]|uniref:Uncharacterized protein n=1 Tax=Geoanaerobacter pelophilus TaxID=60036 RepID=A0AAW4KY16_9BACT|nr:hypothetical protein [Geoanaerobacter pelophilus]MBT0663634.1 hypothetical protein [Geoanaerobacter pelophilus]
MKSCNLAILLAALTLLMAFPIVSFAVTDEEIIESVKNDPKVRQRVLEVTLPAERRERLDDPQKTIDEDIYKKSEFFVVPLNSQCGVAGCGGNKLVVIRYERHVTNAYSRYIAALVRIKNMKIKEISLATISPEDKQP